MNLQDQKISVLWILKSGILSSKDIRRAGGKGVLHCNGSCIQALVKLYPELMLKKEDFFQPKKEL